MVLVQEKLEIYSLEEILSISSEAIKTRAPKKCINKSICWHPEGTRGVPMEGAHPVANQIDLFMHFLGDSLLLVIVGYEFYIY